VDVYVGGRAGRHLKDAAKVGAVFGMMAMGVGVEEILNLLLLVGETLEDSTAKAMDLSLGDRPGHVDSQEMTLCDSI
jgi:hypothetical protein